MSITSNDRFSVDGVDFVSGFAAQNDDAFTLVKSPAMLAKYEDLVRRFARPRIVEIGVAYGGSTAWLSLVADPAALVALELSPDRIERLDRLIAERGFGDRVHVHFGVDQADGDTVRRLAAEGLGGQPADVVIDDASHLYGPTLASFEALFPLVRPGGVYVIEDWKWEDELVEAIHVVLEDPDHPDHLAMTAEIDRTRQDHDPSAEDPCSLLALELVQARTESTGPIASVTVDQHWIAIERGPTPLDPTTFRLADLCRNHFQLLRPAAGPAARGA